MQINPVCQSPLALTLGLKTPSTLDGSRRQTCTHPSLVEQILFLNS